MSAANFIFISLFVFAVLGLVYLLFRSLLNTWAEGVIRDKSDSIKNFLKEFGYDFDYWDMEDFFGDHVEYAVFATRGKAVGGFRPFSFWSNLQKLKNKPVFYFSIPLGSYRVEFQFKAFGGQDTLTKIEKMAQRCEHSTQRRREKAAKAKEF